MHDIGGNPMGKAKGIYEKNRVIEAARSAISAKTCLSEDTGLHMRIDDLGERWIIVTPKSDVSDMALVYFDGIDSPALQSELTKHLEQDGFHVLSVRNTRMAVIDMMDPVLAEGLGSVVLPARLVAKIPQMYLPHSWRSGSAHIPGRPVSQINITVVRVRWGDAIHVFAFVVPIFRR